MCGAEVIVVGQLSDIKKNYMTVTYNHDNGKSWSMNMDLGHIRGARILKSDGEVNGNVSVIFDSKDQSRNPFSHMTITHVAGESGIWLLWRDRFSGSYIIQTPYSPLPASQEKDFLRVIKEHKCKSGA